MRRILTLLATVGLLAFPATAFAAPTPNVPTVGTDLTLEMALIKTTINTPTGLEPAVYSRALVTVHYQPIAGSVDMILQEKTSTGVWFNATSAPRVNFPLSPPVGGFAMVAGPYLCSGTNNNWRVALLIHAESHTGQWQGPVTFYYVNGSTTGSTSSNGQRFDCR